MRIITVNNGGPVKSLGVPSSGELAKATEAVGFPARVLWDTAGASTRVVLDIQGLKVGQLLHYFAQCISVYQDRFIFRFSGLISSKGKGEGFSSLLVYRYCQFQVCNYGVYFDAAAAFLKNLSVYSSSTTGRSRPHGVSKAFIAYPQHIYCW